MRFFVYSAYLTAAVFYSRSQPMLGVVAVILMTWLMLLSQVERNLEPNEGPWNEPAALDLSLSVLPRMNAGLSLFGPVYATFALSMY